MENNSKRNSNKGFTLVELLVVIAIMAILMSMSFGGFYMIRKAQVNGATKDIATQISRARSYAMTHDKPNVRVYFRPDGSNVMMARIQYETDSGYVDKFTESMGKGIKLSFYDSEGTSLNLGNSGLGMYIYFDNRSGRITKVSYDFGSTERELTGENSVSGTLTVELAKGGTTKVGNIKLYYENGTVE